MRDCHLKKNVSTLRRITQLIICLGLASNSIAPYSASAAETSRGASTYKGTVESIIREIRPKPDLKGLETFVRKAPSIPASATLQAKAKILSRYIFEKWHLKADNSYESRSNKDNVLPDSVLAAHQGHCLGLTTLFLIAAEARGLNAKLVRAPDHVFPRLCDKNSCVDVETLRKGQIVDDSFYVTNLTITKDALEKRIYLTSLDDPRELAASLYLGLGYITAHAHQTAVAELFYKRAIENSPNFAEAYSNLASIEAELGDTAQTLSLLKKAISINPTHYATLLNLGIYYQSKKQFPEALSYLNRALEANPLSVQAYRRRAQLYADQGKLQDALLDLEKILVIQPNFCDVRETRLEYRKKLKFSAEDKDLPKLRAENRCLSLPI